MFIDVLCVVGHDRLGNGGTNGVNLGRDTTTLHANADIKVAEFFFAENKDRLEHLQSHRFRLDQLNGLTIYLNKTAALLGKGDSSGGLLPVVKGKPIV